MLDMYIWYSENFDVLIPGGGRELLRVRDNVFVFRLKEKTKQKNV